MHNVLELSLLGQTLWHHLQLHDHVGQSNGDLFLDKVERLLLARLVTLLQQTLDRQRRWILLKV